jgi:RNA polymerase sigma-70 factor (ECF subfamily)
MPAVESNDGRLTALDERRLIERAQVGCPDSAHELVVAYQHRLHAFVCRMVRNPHEAEEVCQDTFLRAFGALDSFDFTYRFSTWLFTIGYRLCLNTLRRRKDFSGDVDFSAMAESGRNDSDDLPLADAVANSDEARRLKKIIWEAVDQLTPQQRATVLLFYREAMSCQEIGDVLEMPAATVKSHLHRARNRLKELLESHLVEDWTLVRFGTAAGSA